MMTATVETITAEVRVLMVGNRQVTLSVYRQLDAVDLKNVEPFGRVNDGKEACLWVVGREIKTGALVKAEVKSHVSVIVTSDHLNGQTITMCDARIAQAQRLYWPLRSQSENVTLFYDEECVEGCGIPGHVGLASNDVAVCKTDPNGTSAAIVEIHSEAQAEWKLHQAAANLPLIVLAGLR